MYQVANMSREGLKFLDSIFFKHRSKTITKGRSWHETQNTPEKIEKIEAIAKRLNTTPYQAFQLWYGSVNQFRPAIAKYIYTKYKPSSIMDFSAGWAGRCLGALEMGIPYYGIDTNTNLKQAYSELFLQRPGHATIYFQPSESFDFSTVQYDMIFTSPPYFMIEKYEHMPEYISKADFLNRFFIPTVTNAWEHLAINGHMCLNMPHDMYEAIKDILPPLLETLDMPIASRFTKFSKAKRCEHIYVWRK